MSGWRLAQGGLIDRARPLRFTFNGAALEGLAGDTLASALIANGVTTVARSFKYHRRRGIVAAGAEEPNALVQVGSGARTTPNLRATQVALEDGLAAHSVNAWPDVALDAWALNDRLGGLLPAGFYYKTFKWPRALWPFYERAIRHAAGLGTAPRATDPDRYEQRHAHCDVLVVGGGPAGLAAALAASRGGARVILADEDFAFGGSLLGQRVAVGGRAGAEWAASAAAELADLPEVTVLSRTTVAGAYDHGFFALIQSCAAGPLPDPSHKGEGTESARTSDSLQARTPGPLPLVGRDGAGVAPRERLWKVRAKQTVLASGSIERPIVFADNDLPGVMLAGAARAYVNRFAAAPGRRAVVFANNDSAYLAARDLIEAGIAVPAIVDVREAPSGPHVEAVRAKGVAVVARSAVTAAMGRRCVAGVRVAPVDGGPEREIACDLVLVSGGWTPTLHVFSQAGGRQRYDAQRAAFVPDGVRAGLRVAGAANGAFALHDALREGFAAGAAAAADAGFPLARVPDVPTVEPEPEGVQAFWRVARRSSRRKAFADLHTDVTDADIALAAREGYEAVEHLKRYTTAGMGPDQGKTGNLNALAILAEIRGAKIEDVGTTTFRPPYTPVTFGAMAGRNVGDELFAPVRRTPMHAWHARAGAVSEDVGAWKRPFCYPRAGESPQDAVQREARAARTSVALLDASTLGKIDLKGPDAVKLLNRVYTNAWNKLEVGHARYGLMLREDGMVFDDGITARLGAEHYLMTTTSGNAAPVHGWLEEWLQCEWRDLDVWTTSVTTSWATVAVCGPKARDLLTAVAAGVDLSPEAFPHMAVRAATVAGIAARILRASYTGELSYEISVPASQGMALWHALLTAGERYGATPIGTEALHVLRAEKGYIAVGQDTDGSVTPLDLGMGWAVSRKKDFLGKRSLARSAVTRAGRRQFVGLATEEPALVLPEGAHVVREVRPRPPMPMEGHVTSSYMSPNLGRSIALALVRDGLSRKGETVQVWCDGRAVAARVCDPVFFDPANERLHA